MARPRKNIEENARLKAANKEAGMRGREKCGGIVYGEFGKKNTVENGFTLVTTVEKKGEEMIYVQVATTVHI